MSAKIFLTVTANPVLDKVLLVEEWQRGRPIHAQKLVTSVGGKGLDASVALRHLGQQTVGLHFSAGRAGHELLERLEDYGILPEAVWVNGETRTAYIIAEARHAMHTHIFSGGLEISPAQRQDFLARYRRHLGRARWVLTGGRLPATLETSFLGLLVEAAAQAGVPALVDSSGQPLLECLAARPAVVKMNQDEFSQTFGGRRIETGGLKQAAAQVYQQHALSALVITCGAQGILAFTPQGCFHAHAPAQAVVNAAGAGDAASAALAWRLAQGESWPEALRWAAAVSAASVLTEGTADLRLEDATRILPQVTLEPA